MKRLLTITGVLLLLVFLTSQCEKILKSEIKIQTGTILDQSFTTASVEGNIIEFGKGISEYGHCWLTSSDPTYEVITRTTFGERKTTGSFKSDLSGLSPGTKYYIRAYALNEDDEVVYGDNLEIMTKAFTLPTVSTVALTAVTDSSASGGGTVSDDGGAPVSARGVCWSTSETPTIADRFTSDGSGTGNFASTLSRLKCGTPYFMRAYATNSVGTAYGSQVSFNTSECQVSLPAVTTSAISGIQSNSANGGGNVVSDGGAPVVARGVCWSTAENPTLSDFLTTDGSGTGSFTSSISGLECGTTYYVRAYASNSQGTTYGDQRSFTTMPCNFSLPTVLTSNINSITTISANGGGNATDDGGKPITAKGVCWSTSPGPALSDFYTADGTGKGVFTSAIAPLTSGMKYYVRAYATNLEGTAYGEELSFTTLSLPTVLTLEIGDITDISSQGGGEVTNDGGADVTARGVCWSSIPNPTVADNVTHVGSGTESFTSAITGLDPSTTYYVRAYATNTIGTAYGTEFSFKTWAAMVLDYDKNVYYGLQIGEQVWMTSNLKTTHRPDGYMISNVEDAATWADEFTSIAYCWYDNNPANADAYGALYTWECAMLFGASSDENPSGVQGICSDGWHLPSDSEWKELEMYLGMTRADADKYMASRGTDEGGKLKELGFEHWNSPNTGATNESGFTARAGGFRSWGGSFGALGGTAFFWTATSILSDAAWPRGLDHDNSKISRDYNNMKNGMSVRCVKD